MSYACIECYQQSNGRCEHFLVTATAGVTSDAVSCHHSAKVIRKAINILCLCGLQVVKFFQAGGYYTLYRCGCGRGLLFTALNRVISSRMIRSESGVKYPRATCLECSGTMKRSVNSFRRCGNCDGTGGIRGGELCRICNGGGAVISGCSVFECDQCQEESKGCDKKSKSCHKESKDCDKLVAGCEEDCDKESKGCGEKIAE